MKLSKVKKVCMNDEEIVIKRADTGLDVRTWIGTNWAQYPVRGLIMTAEMAERIWEIEPKKIAEMAILEDMGENEAVTMITRADLEKVAFLGDAIERDDEQEAPGLAEVATVNNWLILMDRKTKKAWLTRTDRLAPVENKKRIYIPVEVNRNLIAVYADGMLEAVLYMTPWNQTDYIKRIMQQIAEICWEESEKR